MHIVSAADSNEQIAAVVYLRAFGRDKSAGVMTRFCHDQKRGHHGLIDMPLLGNKLTSYHIRKVKVSEVLDRPLQ